MRPAIIISGAIVFVIGVAVAAMIGLGGASSVAIEYATSIRSEDGALSSTIDEDVANKLGGIGNAIFGILAVVASQFAGILRIAAGWADLLGEYLKPKPSQNGKFELSNISDEEYDMWDRQLIKAVEDRDREVVLLSIRKLSGSDFMTIYDLPLHSEPTRGEVMEVQTQRKGQEYDPLTQITPK